MRSVLRNKVFAFALIALLLATTLVAGCAKPKTTGQTGTTGGTTAGGPKRGGTLTVGISGDPITLDPHKSASMTDRNYYYQIYDPLVTLGADGSIQPGLAEKWDNPDPKTYIFHLRTGVKFHDGTDFNATIAKWNFDRMLDPKAKLPRLSEINMIDTVTVTDANTLKITLKTPYAPFLTVLTDRSGMMVSKAAVEKLGDDFARKPVGTGPFIVTEWTPKSQVVLRRFDQYWDKPKPYLDGVVYKIIPDETVRLTSLKTGEVGLIDTIPPKDVASVKASGEYTVAESPSQAYDYLDLNTKQPPFNNKALRQAVAWAIDRQAIQQTVYYNVGAVANSPFPASLWAHDPNFVPYTRDVAKAKAAMAAGGQPNGFSFKLTMTNTPLNVLVGQVIQGQLKEVGIDMQLDLVDSSALSAALTSGKYQACRAGWSGRADPDGNVYTMFTTNGSINYRKLSNKTLDDLLEKARAATTQAERKTLYQQAAQIIADESVLVFIHSDQFLHPMKKNVKGYKMISDGRIRLAGVWLE